MNTKNHFTGRAAALLAVALLFPHPPVEAQPTGPQRRGSVTNRHNSPSKTRRPRAGSVRTSRTAPKKPTAAAAANTRAAVQRATGSGGRPGTPAAGPRVRPRTASSSTRGEAPAARARRSSVTSLTGGYRAPDPSALTGANPGTGGGPSGGAGAGSGSGASGSTLAPRRYSDDIRALRASTTILQTQLDVLRNQLLETTNRTYLNQVLATSRP